MRVDPGLRIAILVPSMPPWHDGFETVAEELGARLAAAGHDISVFCPATGFTPRQTQRAGLHCIYLRTPPLGLLTGPVAQARALARATRGFDLVYVFGLDRAMLGLWRLLSGTPLWINTAGMRRMLGPTGLWQTLRERMALSAADAIVTDAEAVLDQLRTRHGWLPRSMVIPFGAEVVSYADPELLADFELAPGCYYLAVCRLVPENNVREIVEGFLAAHSAFPLVIAGDFETDTSYVRHLRSLAGARVRFIGVVSDSRHLRVLRCHARAYLHGHSVGTSRALLEALGCGNAIIAHDNAFNRELAGELARYFRHAEDMPAAVAWAEDLDGPERRMRTAAAQERLRTRHSWERVTAQYLAAFQSLRHLP